MECYGQVSAQHQLWVLNHLLSLWLHRCVQFAQLLPRKSVRARILVDCSLSAFSVLTFFFILPCSIRITRAIVHSKHMLRTTSNFRSWKHLAVPFDVQEMSKFIVSKMHQVDVYLYGETFREAGEEASPVVFAIAEGHGRS